MFNIEGGGGGGNSSLVVVFGLFFSFYLYLCSFFLFFCIDVSTGCACFSSSSLAHRSTTLQRFCSLTLLNTVSTSSYCPK